jgi:catechol-2,3-dioxygenase
VDDLRDFYNRLQENNVRIDQTVTHGFALSVYFFDPEDNRVEIYYTTPYNTSPPVNVQVDLNSSTDELLELSGSFPQREEAAARS